MEPHFIKEYDSFHNGYNMNEGGTGLIEHSEETKHKMSENNFWRGKNRSGSNNPMTGRKHSKESIEKMKRNRKGKTAGRDHHMFGKQHSKETLKKMRQKAVGNGGWNKGIPMSDETKKKLSESKRGTIRNTKKFQITKPDGTTEIIENLSKYCRENNLHNGNMCNVSKGKLNHYKGYRVISL